MENVIWTEASDEVKKFCSENQDNITKIETSYIESENKKTWEFTVNKKKVNFEQFFRYAIF